jgi:hypothetical protein
MAHRKGSGRDVNVVPVVSSVADPGCLFRIPDPTFFHPGFRIRTVSIPDPGSASQNLSFLTPKNQKKWFLSSRKYDPGCSSRIRMLTFYPSRIQGSKRHQIPDPDPGTGSATLVVSIKNYLCRSHLGLKPFVALLWPPFFAIKKVPYRVPRTFVETNNRHT